MDGTNFYLFNSYEPGRSGYVTVIANYLPLQDAYGGPNYFALDEDALYEILIDNDGDAREDLTFQFNFSNRLGNDDAGLALDVGSASVAVPLKNIGPVSASDRSLLNFREVYRLQLVRGDRRGARSAPVTRVANGSAVFLKPYDFVGTKTFGSVEGYEAYARRHVYDIAIQAARRQGAYSQGNATSPSPSTSGKSSTSSTSCLWMAASSWRHPAGPANDIISDKNITTLALERRRAAASATGTA